MRADNPRPLVPLSRLADRLGMTASGVLHVLRRTNAAIRDDGHWFCDPDKADQIERARQELGLASRKGIGGRKVTV
jgi:hypothetical protein